MTLDVECHAGYRGDQEPRAFVIEGRRFEVTAIADRWAGPDYRYFKVTADDGHLYVLRHDERTHTWSLGAFRAAGPPR